MAQDQQPAAAPKQRDWWDKSEIIAKGFAAVLLPAAIAFYGVYTENSRSREAEQNRKDQAAQAEANRRAQVVIVSPHVFMLAINTIQTLMRDARMREQASLIQKEVGQLAKDVKLLADATEKLQRHMGQADGDIKDILTRAGRIVSRADKIDKVELSTPEAGKALPAK